MTDPVVLSSSRAVEGANWQPVLLLILGFAAVIRIVGIWYGLPYIYWTDEYHEVMRAMALGAGSFDLERTSKGGFYLLLFFEYGIYYVVLKLIGAVSNTREFAEAFVQDPTTFYLIGRATAAIFGIATVAVVYSLARRAYGLVAGLLAAAFLAVNVLHVSVSHRVGVDIPLVFFAAWTLYFGSCVSSDGRRRDYVLAALFAALAMTTKLPGVLLLVPLAIAHSYAVAKLPGGLRSWFVSRELWIAAATFAVVLVASNPGIIFRIGELITGSPSTGGVNGDLDLQDDADPELVTRPVLYLYYLAVLRDSMGWPLFGVAMLSTAYALWKRSAVDLILVSYALANYLAISSTSSEVLYYPRYALPIVVVLVVLAGRALSDLALFFPHRRAAAVWLISLLLVAWPLIDSVRDIYPLTQTDTRTLAKNWFDQTVPVGSKVLIEGSKIAASRESVPIIDSLESLERRIAYWQEVEPQQAKFLKHLLTVHPGGGYELHLVRLKSVATLEEYASQGVEYFVVRPEPFLGSRRAKGSTARLLQDLRSDPRVTMLRRFEAESWIRPGPIVEIYQLRPNSTPSN